jgi:hypothetical protein
VSPDYSSSADKLVKRLSIDKWNRVFLSYSKGLFPPLRAIRQYSGCSNMAVSYGRYLREIIRSWLR